MFFGAGLEPGAQQHTTVIEIDITARNRTEIRFAMFSLAATISGQINQLISINHPE